MVVRDHKPCPIAPQDWAEYVPRLSASAPGGSQGDDVHAKDVRIRRQRNRQEDLLIDAAEEVAQLTSDILRAPDAPAEERALDADDGHDVDFDRETLLGL